jgi:hypothetical protein
MALLSALVAMENPSPPSFSFPRLESSSISMQPSCFCLPSSLGGASELRVDAVGNGIGWTLAGGGLGCMLWRRFALEAFGVVLRLKLKTSTFQISVCCFLSLVHRFPAAKPFFSKCSIVYTSGHCTHWKLVTACASRWRNGRAFMLWHHARLYSAGKRIQQVA